MKRTTLLLFYLLVVASALSQKIPTNSYEYIKYYEDDIFNKTSDDTTQIEIFLLGTFHFKKKFEVPEVKNQILAFQPEMLFIEEVDPTAPYKVEHKNYLYRNWGDKYYSNAIDSLSLLMNLKLAEVDKFIEKEKFNLSINPEDHFSRMRLINAHFIGMNEANASLQLAELRQNIKSEPQKMKDSIWQTFSPYHRKSLFSLGETRYLTAPTATALTIEELHYMDYQADWQEIDSVLSITMRKLMPRLLLKIWKLPYFIKMMKLDQKGPRNEKEALDHFKILNHPKTFINMAKMNEVYFKKEKVAESIQFNALYRKRNANMVTEIVDQVSENDPKKIFIIVGASHVPYFLWELHQQLPNAQIKFLDIEDF